MTTGHVKFSTWVPLLKLSPQPFRTSLKLMIWHLNLSRQLFSSSASNPRRTSTASARSQCSPPDLNHKESARIYQIECQKVWQIECQKICQKVRQNRCQIECQIECQNICQTEFQIECQNKYAIYTSRWYVRSYVMVRITRRKYLIFFSRKSSKQLFKHQ